MEVQNSSLDIWKKNSVISQNKEKAWGSQFSEL